MTFGKTLLICFILLLLCLSSAFPLYACKITMATDVINKPVNDVVFNTYRLKADAGRNREASMRNTGGKMLLKSRRPVGLTFSTRSILMINSPPTFTSTPVVIATVGSIYVYDIAVTDPDGDPLAVTATTLPSWLSLAENDNGTMRLQGTPQLANCTDNQVTLVVKEKGENGLIGEQSFEIEIMADLTVSIETDRTAICANELVTFNTNVTGGITGTSYEWFIDDQLVLSGLYPSFQTNSIRENRLVKVNVIIEPAECIVNTNATSDPLPIKVKESLEPSVTVDVEKTSICAGENVEFRAVLSEGGPNPVYTWFINDQVIEEESSANFITDFLADGDVISVEVNTDEAPCTTNTTANAAVTMHVTENILLAVTLTSDHTMITVGETVTFTASTDYTGSAVQYQWFINNQVVNGEAAASFATNSLENNDKVKVKLITEPVECLVQNEVESEEIAIVVNDVVEPKVEDIAKTTDEDEELAFKTGDFALAFTGSLATLRITSLPVLGTLTLHGASVSINQEMAASQISGLKYIPDTNVNGEDTFGWNGSNGNFFAENEAAVHITIHPVNDPPEFTLSGHVFVSKNFTTVEQVTITPEEVPADELHQSVTYQLIPPAVSFANLIFDPQNGRVAITSLFDQTGKQEFEIIANDGQVANNIHIESFILEVKSANVSPPKDIAADHLFIPENQPRGTLIGTITVTDDDPNDRHVLNLDDHNTLFFIDGNQLKTNAVLDFEEQATYEVSVRATDLGGNFLVERFTITVTDENDLPTDLKISTHEIVENAPIGTQIGKLIALDQDAGDRLHFVLVADVAANSLFSLSDNVLVSDVVFDFEESEEYEIVVRVEDENGGAIEEVITIVVIDVEPEEIEIISGFTPDNDRMNDTWEIAGLVSYPRCTVAVYNSWGQQVFFSRGYSKPWDGTYKNNDVPVGTYYYIIALDNDQPPLTGNIAVMR